MYWLASGQRSGTSFVNLCQVYGLALTVSKKKSQGHDTLLLWWCCGPMVQRSYDPTNGSLYELSQKRIPCLMTSGLKGFFCLILTHLGLHRLKIVEHWVLETLWTYYFDCIFCEFRIIMAYGRTCYLTGHSVADFNNSQLSLMR